MRDNNYSDEDYADLFGEDYQQWYESFAEHEWLEDDNKQRAADMNGELEGSQDLHHQWY